MKRNIIISIIILVFFVFGCNKQQTVQPATATVQPTTETEQLATVTEQPVTETEQPATDFDSDNLTYEEILALSRVEVDGGFVLGFKNIDDAYLHYDNSFVASCEVLSVKYYLDWNNIALEGHSIIEARIKEVKDEYNSTNVKAGDILQCNQSSYIRFANFDDTLAFFSEKTGVPLKKNDTLRGLENCSFELIPQRGKEYELLNFPNEYPVKVGESYTLFVVVNSKRSSEGNPYGSGRYICPVNSEVSLEQFAKEHDFDYEDNCIALAEEIAALFK